ncbi:MAG: hypothetical protein FWF71_00150 [Actinomycetia bacterium]|nr:hypothetical protein [Actinomycetes bacterium]
MSQTKHDNGRKPKKAAVLAAGTAAVAPDRRPASKAVCLVFILMVFALLLLPSLGMLWAPKAVNLENRQLAAFPQASSNGGISLNYPAQLGSWYEEHYAFRNLMVSLNAKLYADVFGTSASQQVLVGHDGWLYYAGEVADYTGTAPLSERALFNIAHNLRLVQDYCLANGADFCFMVAPNKSSLYPQAMPSYYLPSSNASNYQRLLPWLDKQGVHYVDLFPSFLGAATLPDGSQASPLYHARDSHWNNRGALLAEQALAAELGWKSGLPSLAEADGQWTWRHDFRGDMDQMLYPGLPTLEDECYLSGVNDGAGASGSQWSYVGDAQAVDSNYVQTRGGGAGGRLLMFRDSFGNTLLPYLAADSQSAVFSKLVPYYLEPVASGDYDAVVVERAQRHLADLAEQVPLAPSPAVDMDLGTAELAARPGSNAGGAGYGRAVVTPDGPLLHVTGGLVPGGYSDDALIYVALDGGNVDGLVLEAYCLRDPTTGSDFGYRVSLPAGALEAGGYQLRVVVADHGKLYLVHEEDLELSQ